MACHKTLPLPCGDHDHNHHHHHHHHDDGCTKIACECADSAAHSAKAASDAAMLAQKILQNCLTDKTIKPGGGLLYEEGTPPGEGGIIVNVADIINQMLGLGVDANGDAIVKLMENGGLAFNGNGEIFVKPDNFIRVGGGLAIGTDGQVYLDLSQMTAANRVILVNQMIQEGGGLAVDGEGTIYVDFSKMPTDKFEALLKSIRVPIWLTGNMDLFVDCNSDGNSLVDGRGTLAKPFKNIQACVDYLTGNYNLVNFLGQIRIAPGTYNENLYLGEYSRTTGMIALLPYNGAIGQVNINMKDKFGINCIGGPYLLAGLNLNMRPQYADSNIWTAISLGYVNSGADLLFRACAFDMTDFSGLAANANVELRMFAGYGGQLTFIPSLAGERRMSLKYAKLNDKLCSVLYGERGAHIQADPTNLEASLASVSCEGATDKFLYMQNSAFTRLGGATNLMTFDVDSGKTATGKRYELGYGSSAIISGAGENYFPGNEAGTVDAETYSWIK